MQPKVSVIVPVYNPPAQYLRECLDSICNQTLKDIEIILIDNAAIGDNPQILKEYAKKDKRIKLFRFEENQGAAGAVNKGIALSTAAYFQIVDSDDVLKPQACTVLYNTIKENPVDLVIFNADRYLVQDKRTIASSVIQLKNSSIQNILNQETTINSCPEILTQTTAQYWNKLYKKSAVLKYNNFLCTDLYAALPDVLFTIKQLVFSKSIIVINTSLYIYREGCGLCNNYTLPNCPYRNAPFILTTELLKFIKQESINPKVEKQILIKGIIHHLLQFFNWTPECEKKQFFEQMKILLLSYDKTIFTNFTETNDFYNLLMNNDFWNFRKSFIGSIEKKISIFPYYNFIRTRNETLEIFLRGLFKIKQTKKYTKYYILGISFYKKNRRTKNG